MGCIKYLIKMRNRSYGKALVDRPIIWERYKKAAEKTACPKIDIDNLLHQQMLEISIIQFRRNPVYRRLDVVGENTEDDLFAYWIVDFLSDLLFEHEGRIDTLTILKEAKKRADEQQATLLPNLKPRQYFSIPDDDQSVSDILSFLRTRDEFAERAIALRMILVEMNLRPRD